MCIGMCISITPSILPFGTTFGTTGTMHHLDMSPCAPLPGLPHLDSIQVSIFIIYSHTVKYV